MTVFIVMILFDSMGYRVHIAGEQVAQHGDRPRSNRVPTADEVAQRRARYADPRRPPRDGSNALGIRSSSELGPELVEIGSADASQCSARACLVAFKRPISLFEVGVQAVGIATLYGRYRSVPLGGPFKRV
jgi:hypothetical protein